MKRRKGGDGKPRDESKPIDTPVGELGEKDTIMHYNAVMLEEIKSKMELVIEYMATIKHGLEQKIEELRNEMNQRFDALNYKIDKIATRVDDHETRLVARESCH